MSITNLTIVRYLSTTKITDYDYTNATGEDVDDTELAIGVDCWDNALICAGGDFMEAARTYNIKAATLWSNFNAALYSASSGDFATSATIKAYFRTAFATDYPESTAEDEYTFTELYNVIFIAVVNCWLYDLYSRIEAEKLAEDKQKKCKKLLYDVIGKAAISPEISDPIDMTTSGSLNTSSGASCQQGDMSEDLLDGFTNGFDGF